jgi:L-threonylcarbamoyladenylate synthase
MLTTKVVETSAVDALSAAGQVIRAGGLIAYPTDTVYGLAADFRNADAIEKIYAAKDRDSRKPVAILVGSSDQLELVMQELTPGAARLAARFWPGALTLIVPRRGDLPENLSPYMTIGVRMPNHPWALQLLRELGPLATTSANLSGQPDAVTAQDVLQYLDGRVDLVLDGGRCPGGVPSTVVDCTSTEPRILREGALTAKQILLAWGDPEA